jgi:membrane protease YdiL (CAAX protease family)
MSAIETTTTELGAPYSSVDWLPDSRIRWGLKHAVVIVAIFACYPLFALAVRAIFGGIPLSAAVWLGPVAYILLLASAVFLSRTRGTGQLAKDFGFRARPRDLGWGVLTVVAYYIAFFIVIAVILSVTADVPTGNVELGNEVWQNVVLGVTVIVFAPIVEELIFRGLVMRSIRKAVLGRSPVEASENRRHAAVQVSIVVSAMVFAALHLYEAPDLVSGVVLGLAAFIIGLMLGFVATRTGRLGPGIVAHVIINTLAFSFGLAGQ